MKPNVGGIDRILRILIGLMLIIAAMTHLISWWGYLGIIPLLTGIFSRCLFYKLLGIQTCSIDK